MIKSEHSLVKLLDFKDEKNVLKSSSKDQIIYKDKRFRLPFDSSKGNIKEVKIKQHFKKSSRPLGNSCQHIRGQVILYRPQALLKNLLENELLYHSNQS